LDLILLIRKDFRKGVISMNIRLKSLLIMLLICSGVRSFARGEIVKTHVTVYNENLGLVRQLREVEVEHGLSEIRIEGVSAQIDPTSVHISFPQAADRLMVLEQNFLYDLVNSAKIFEKYIGETIRYRLENGEKYSGQLLSVDGSRLVLQIPDGGIRVAAIQNIWDYEFPSLPAGLILKPTLQWLVDSQVRGKQTAELSYLTTGMSWHAEYVLVLAQNDRDLTLASWVSLDNNSGATYTDAKLKLVAGQIQRAPRQPAPREAYDAVLMKSVEMAAPQFEERAFFDYHLYELQRPVTLKDKELKQVSLLDETAARGQKVYTFYSSASQDNEGPLTVTLRVPNTEDNQLGMPLPEGIVRMFRRDIDQTLQLIGEDRIQHTSKNDTLELTVGKAFDVKGQHVVKNVEQIGKRSQRVSVEIKLINRKPEAVFVLVQEGQYGSWEVKEASHKYIAKSNALLVFPLELAAESSETISYIFLRNW
jgi:hypothetical protein